jgi:hypothetical protein
MLKPSDPEQNLEKAGVEAEMDLKPVAREDAMIGVRPGCQAVSASNYCRAEGKIYIGSLA